MTSNALTGFEQKMLDIIGEHGCHVTNVFDPDGKFPNFAYSTGFTYSLKQPEVVIIGLDQKIMHSMINNLYSQCTDGLVLSDWLTIDGLLEGYQCIARTVTEQQLKSEFFACAQWFSHYRLGVPLKEGYQIVWPGAASGEFPWDENCPSEITDYQPALYAKDQSL